MHAENLSFSDSMNWLADAYHLSNGPMKRQTRKDIRQRQAIIERRKREKQEQIDKLLDKTERISRECDFLRDALSARIGTPEMVADWRSRLDYLEYDREVTFGELDAIRRPHRRLGL